MVKKISLDKFKGKFIYLDYWATWCKPCKDEIPFIKELAEKYKQKDIEFLSVAVWDKKEDWTSFLAKSDMNWEHVYAGSDDRKLTDMLGIVSIPAFIIVDKEGKIITLKAERPSNPNLIKILDDLVK